MFKVGDIVRCINDKPLPGMPSFISQPFFILGCEYEVAAVRPSQQAIRLKEDPSGGFWKITRWQKVELS